jgi:hypothetical protein
MRPFIELLVCLGDRRLVWDGQHPHPAAQHAHLVNGVEGLRSPDTCITANVLPCVGRTAPTDRGIQSIWVFIKPVMAPWRSGELHTMLSAHCTSSCSSLTFG